jgi:ABC-type Na+ transport system ATPase subunit NatA
MLLSSSWSQADIVDMFSVDNHQVIQSSHSMNALGAAPHHVHCQNMQVLLLDEITVDLDVLGRADLMRFLVEECEARGASIIYATHIFDGLEFWPTHVAYVARGE